VAIDQLFRQALAASYLHKAGPILGRHIQAHRHSLSQLARWPALIELDLL
jgi:hypothetical protein